MRGVCAQAKFPASSAAPAAPSGTGLLFDDPRLTAGTDISGGDGRSDESRYQDGLMVQQWPTMHHPGLSVHLCILLLNAPDHKEYNPKVHEMKSRVLVTCCFHVICHDSKRPRGRQRPVKSVGWDLMRSSAVSRGYMAKSIDNHTLTFRWWIGSIFWINWELTSDSNSATVDHRSFFWNDKS